jgi:hypothetical protein
MNNIVIDCALSAFIGDYFKNLMNSFTEGGETSGFSLEKTGHIVILEAKDNINTCLNKLGITDILKAPLEYCNLINLQNKKGKTLSVYQAFMLFNNEYCLTLFAESSILPLEVKAFFNNNI